jgi:hypothetical protein
LKEFHKTYLLKKGAADPFRGDWYIYEESFASAEEAITQAAALTLAQYNTYLLSWEQYGYEWSVFEKEGDSEKKIWEGYKYIMGSLALDKSPDITLGNIP